MRTKVDKEVKQVGCQTREDEEMVQTPPPLPSPPQKNRWIVRRISRQNEEGAGRISTNRMKSEQMGKGQTAGKKGG